MNLAILTERFGRLMSSRGLLRHFRRIAAFDLFQGSPINKDVPASLADKLIDAASKTPTDLLLHLNSHADGLSDARAGLIRTEIGSNTIEQDKPLTGWQHLWHCYVDPFNLLLTLLAIVSYYTEDTKATIVISSMVALSTLMRFFQEARSNKAADKLKEMVSNTATVLRRDLAADAAEEAQRYFQIRLTPKPSRQADIPFDQLVPGDIVLLSAGDMIPADLRVLTAKDLFVSQAAMTGESLPVEKFPCERKSGVRNALELDSICFMGTNVVSGSATAVVVTTGNRTYFGALAQRISSVNRAPTAFQTGVNKVSWLLIRFMLVMTPIVLLINGLTKGNWLEAFLFALSVAVGLTPEMLPMIVTSTLARGAVVLSRKKVIVKRLDAIQNFGAMDILCTDKTGTLTQDKIFLKHHTDVFGKESNTVLEYAYLNSYYQTGLKNLLDVAVLEHREVHRDLDPAANFRKIDEIPFDFKRRRMSVVVAERDEHHLLICKGAIEEMLSVCSHYEKNGATLELDEPALADISSVTTALNHDGLRVVGVAIKDMPPMREAYGVNDERDLTLVGYIAFLDPPKESAAPALQALKANGVAVKVLTGDNELVTSKICHEVGLPVTKIMLGADIEHMSDRELYQATLDASIFAKLTPAHKERIVRVLHQSGHVVGFMGDGINDAAALRAADIGISVDTAVDIAKEAADIILLEKSLMVLEEGVIEGRRTFSNMLKYIKMTASSNFGNVFSVLTASAFLPFLPMLPMHLLVQNLLYDISQTGIPFDNVDHEFLNVPQRWDPDSIGRFMLYFGPLSSIFDIMTYCLMWFVFGANNLHMQTLFQSGWFLEGLMSQTLIVHLIRTRKIPFIQSRASWAMIGMTLSTLLIGLFIVMGPFAHYFRLQPLPASYFPWLIMILFGYLSVTQVMKGFYYRRFGWQ